MRNLEKTQEYNTLTLIREFILYEFEVEYNAAESTKNISCLKGEGFVDYYTVTKYSRKFDLPSMNLDKIRST